MKDFITEIGKIPTNNLLYTFSQMSIEMFRQQECQKEIPIAITNQSGIKKGAVLLMGWDIHSIAYYSVVHSNDFRTSKKVSSVEEIINLYRKYDNENSVASKLAEADLDGIFRIIMGMTSEQFLFQQLNLVFEKFNRDYYILLAAEHFKHRADLDVNCIVKETFGYSADDYCFVMTIRELEILLYLHKHIPKKLDTVCEKIKEQITKDGQRKSLGAIFESLGIYDNPHSTGTMDYFHQLLKQFEKQLKPDV